MMHSGGNPQKFVVPRTAAELPWRLFVDTAAESPKDIYPGATGPLLSATSRCSGPPLAAMLRGRVSVVEPRV